MKKFNSYSELLDNIGALKSEKAYAEKELNNYLEDIGSSSINDNIESIPTFYIFINNIDYEIGVISEYIETEEDEVINYTYILFD